jgi:predicted alpha/beta hydrolase family esterase
MTREFSVHKAAEYHPIGDRRGTVLMLPGRGYSCGMSLLAWTTRALQATGWTVLQAEWELSGVPVQPREFVENVAQQLDETERQPGPVLVVAKSLGTLAAHWAAEQAYPAVWLTPVSKDRSSRAAGAGRSRDAQPRPLGALTFRPVV